MEEQTRLLPAQLEGLSVQQPHMVNIYALAFAPIADEDAFLRERGIVGQVVQQRFRAPRESPQFVNHKSAVSELPWAKPMKLQLALQPIAHRMDKEENIVFIHLTSLGAKDGSLRRCSSP